MTKMTDTAAAAAIGAATRELRLPVVRTDAARQTKPQRRKRRTRPPRARPAAASPANTGNVNTQIRIAPNPNDVSHGPAEAQSAEPAAGSAVTSTTSANKTDAMVATIAISHHRRRRIPWKLPAPTQTTTWTTDQVANNPTGAVSSLAVRRSSTTKITSATASTANTTTSPATSTAPSARDRRGATSQVGAGGVGCITTPSPRHVSIQRRVR